MLTTASISLVTEYQRDLRFFEVLTDSFVLTFSRSTNRLTATTPFLANGATSVAKLRRATARLFLNRETIAIATALIAANRRLNHVEESIVQLLDFPSQNVVYFLSPFANILGLAPVSSCPSNTQSRPPQFVADSQR